MEHGCEAEGDLTDRKGETRRKRLRSEQLIAEVGMGKVSCCVLYLQTQAFPPGGRLMRVCKVQQFVRLKKVRKLQGP